MRTVCADLSTQRVGRRLLTASLMEDHGGDHPLPRRVQPYLNPPDLHREPRFQANTDFDPVILLNRAAYFLAFANRLITPDEAAGCLDVNVQTVREWLENRRLRSYRITSPNRQIDPDDVAALGGNLTEYRRLKRVDNDNTKREEAKEEARRALREVGIKPQSTDEAVADARRRLALQERDRLKAERAGPVYAVEKQRPGWTWDAGLAVAQRPHHSGYSQYVHYFLSLHSWGWGWDWDGQRKWGRVGHATALDAMVDAECRQDHSWQT